MMGWHEWYLWVLLAEGAFWLIRGLRSLWSRYYHRARVLGRQAVSMDWASLGVGRDGIGYKYLYVSKGEMQAAISFDSHRVVLVRPAVERTFKDFVELEQWLQMAKVEGSPVH